MSQPNVQSNLLETINPSASSYGPNDAGKVVILDNNGQLPSSLAANVSGFQFKESVRAATVDNITLSGLQTIDGISLVEGDRVLVKDQSNRVENGIYVVSEDSWSRAADFDDVPSSEVETGAFVLVQTGTLNAATAWILTTPSPVDVGSSDLVFTKFGSGGSVSSVAMTTPVQGITVTGSPITTSGTLSLDLANDLAAIEYMSTRGLATRTATDTWRTRSITAGTGINVTNGDGVAGNPTISLSTPVSVEHGGTGLSDLTPGNYINAASSTTFQQRTPNQVRSDIGAQPLDPTLTALAGFNSNGFVVQTATDTFAARTIVGPSAGIAVTNGNGATGNPTLTLSNDLAAVEGLSTTGIAVRTGTDSWATRTLVAGSSRLSISNASGAVGNPTIDVVESALNLGSMSGVVGISSGGTGQTSANGALNALLPSQTGNSGRFLTTNGTNVSWASVPGSGTVTSVQAVQPSAGLTITGSPITTSGTLTFALANDLAAVEGISSTGFAVRTGTDTWTTRSLAAGSTRITITNASGSSGNPTIDVSESSLNLNNIGGTLSLNKGGTGLASFGASNQILGMNSGGSGLEYKTITAGANITITHSANRIQIAATGGGGVSDHGDLTGLADDDHGAVYPGFAQSETISGSWNFTTAPLIDGNKVWHAGNDGAGSGLAADTLDGYHASENASASTVVARTSSGHIVGTYLRQTSSSNENPTISQFFVESGGDGYLRKASIQHVRDTLGGVGGHPNTLMLTDGNGWADIRVIRNASGVGGADGIYVGYGNAGSGLTRLFGGGSTTASVTIDGSGNLTASGNVTAFSDARLKRNVEPIKDALTKVKKLVGVTFDRVDIKERQTGLIAQDVQKVLPEAVSVSEKGYLAVSYGNMMGLIVEAIKSLEERINQLEGTR